MMSFMAKCFMTFGNQKKMLPLLLQHRSSSLLCALDKFNITIKETDKQNRITSIKHMTLSDSDNKTIIHMLHTPYSTLSPN